MSYTDPDCIAIDQANQNLQSKIITAEATIANLGTQVESLNTQVNTMSSQLGTQLAQISNLTSQFNVEQAIATAEIAKNAVLAEAILRAFAAYTISQQTNLQVAPGWTLAAGAAGNTGATGSGGTGAVTKNSDGSASFSIVPAGPYYNAYFYRNFPSNLPPGAARIFYHHVDYLLDSNAVSVYQALENEAKYWDGYNVYDFAWQARKSTGHWHYFHYTGVASKPGDPDPWIDSGIPFTVTAGQTLAMDALFLIDPENGIKTHVGLLYNSFYYPVNYAEPAVAAPQTNSRFLTSVQLDSNSKGAPYAVTVRHNNAGWL